MNTCPKCSNMLRIERFLYFNAEKCINTQCYDHCHIERFNCCSNPDPHIVGYTIEGGTIQAREQCRTCGRLDAKSLGGYTKQQREALPPMDIQLREKANSAWEQIHAYRSEYLEQSKAIRNKLWMDRYTDYLQSEEWRLKRESVLLRDKHLCQSCLKNRATQVHHRSYEFVDFSGMEPCFDLVAICKPCHEKLHAVRNQRKSA